MAILPKYREGSGPLLQTCLGNYTVSNVLAANVPEIITVPTDQNGKLARYVTFGKGAAADFFAQGYGVNESVNRVTNRTFAEYVTNGTFASDTGWTKGTGWAIGAGVATATTASSDLSQTSAITLLPGYIYTITYTVTRTAGTVTPSIGGTAGTARSSSATFTETIVAGTAAATTQIIAFTGVGFSGTIDNVTVTAWVLGTGWTTDGTTAIATGAISTALSQTINTAYPIVAGQAYLVTYTATRSAGTITVSLGGTAGTARSSSATFAEVIIAGATQALSFGTSGFTGTVDDVTIYPVASTPADSTTGFSGEQNPAGYFLNSTVQTISIVSAGTPTVTMNFYQ